MVGREADYVGFLERAHRAHLDGGRALAALRCAFWVGVTFARGGTWAAGGWLGRAQRLLDRTGAIASSVAICCCRSPSSRRRAAIPRPRPRWPREAPAIGERFGDSDLFALAAHERGHVLIETGRLKEGLRLLDEAMVAVTAGELSPIVSGIVYCGVIVGLPEGPRSCAALRSGPPP